MKFCAVSLLILLCAITAQGQDIKGGEITAVANNSPLQIEATVNFYVQESQDMSRPHVILNWGDGMFDTLFSAIPQSLILDTRLYVYSGQHTYANYGVYILSLRDSFRLSGICNVGQSPETFFVSTQISIYPFLGMNNTPIPTSYAVLCTYSSGFVYHNPGAYDPEGDSMSFSLVPCYTSTYDFPNATINPMTGDFAMPVSGQDSIYLIAIRIDEWRRDSSGQSFHMGYVIRDIVIDVPLIITVEENSSFTPVTVFPNPAVSIISFQFSKTHKNNTLLIYDQVGREVYRKQTTENLISLSVHDFPEGIYFYSILNEQGQSTTGKFVVAR